MLDTLVRTGRRVQNTQEDTRAGFIHTPEDATPWVRHTQGDATWCWPRLRGRDRVSGLHSGVCWTRSRVLDTVEGVLDTVTGVRHGSA